jgi:gliding motility-associated-like protein
MKKILSIFIFCLSLTMVEGAVFTVNSPNDAGAGTLRQALQDASGTGGGPHSITFSLASGTVILLNSDLQINNATNHNGLTINATMGGVPGIILRRNGGAAGIGFDIGWDVRNLTISGFVFQNFEHGIRFQGPCTNSKVINCYFSTNLGGTALQNRILKNGIWLANQCNGVIIGGTGANERNIISGCMNVGNDNNRYGAIQIENNSTGNTIIGNYIGTDVNGTVNLGNGTTVPTVPVDHCGINIRNSSNNNVIDRNVISGSQGIGIHVENNSSGTIIKGNKIGTDVNGNNPIPNRACGIYIDGSNSQIIGYNGGDPNLERNIISGNGGAPHNNFDPNNHLGWNEYNQVGIYMKNASNCLIRGNYIGTTANGLSNGVSNNMGNKYAGIKIIAEGGTNSQNNTIGGTTANDRNVISGNGYGINLGPGNGIELQYNETRNNTILGNYIGLGADGFTPVGNLYNGISILGANNNTIGGNSAGARNYICNNKFGIFIQVDFGWPTYKAASGNIIIGNYIGVTIDGTTPLGNGVRTIDTGEGGGIGIQHGCSNNYIGRDNAGEGNIISANKVGIIIRTEDSGDKLGPPNNNRIYNNIIGLDANGNPLPNTGSGDYGHGIYIYQGSIGTNGLPYNTTIGGTGANQRNIICSNAEYGVRIYSTTKVTAANTISGNYIGVGLNGITDRGNTYSGIYLEKVNGTTISSNTISGNEQHGILINDCNSTTITSNRIGLAATPGAGVVPNEFNGIYLHNGSQSNSIGTASNGNYICGNKQNGIFINEANTRNNTIYANFIGVDTDGNTDYGNLGSGIHILNVTGATNLTNGNKVGGTLATQGNVISGNNNVGVLVENSPYTTIQHNKIGTNTAGTASVGNGSHGLYMVGTSGNGSILTNVISGNGANGVFGFGNAISILDCGSHTVQGNYCGTNAAGTSAIPNLNAGYSSTNSNSNTVGGSLASERNIFSGNSDVGVYMNNSDNSTFNNNYIGATASGNAALANLTHGMYITTGSDNNTFNNNVIAANGTAAGHNGITLVSNSNGNTFTSNRIGIGSSGAALANFTDGINISGGSSNNTIGGTSGSNGNIIANNGGDGIDVSGSTSLRNMIRQNSIYCNALMGINLNLSGTPGNNSYAAPVITSVTSNTVSGTSPSGATIEIFYDADGGCARNCDDPNKRQGKTYIATVTATGTNWTYTLSSGSFTGELTATATGECSGPNCNTSEFSTCSPLCVVTPSNAGADQNLCNQASTTLNANTPGGSETGTWTKASGPAVSFVDANSPTTQVNFDGGTGTYVLVWTIGSGLCTPSRDTMTIINYANPTTSNAGSNNTVCATSSPLSANVPTVGTGVWSFVGASNGATIASTTSASTTVNNLAVGSITLRWTISNGTCTPSTSDVTITRDQVPTTASASGDNAVCATTANISGNTPTVGTGSWSFVGASNGATFGNASNAVTTVDNLAVGTVTVRWSIVNGVCPASTSEVTIRRDDNPTTSNAGSNNTVCATSSPLSANTPTVGTGAWSFVGSSNGATITNTASANTTVNNLAVGSVTLRWTISNGVCTPSTSDVIITRDQTPTAANAGADIDSCVNTSVRLSGNNPTVGSGTWSVSSGSATITDPSNPITTITVTSAPVTLTWSIVNGVCPASQDNVTVTISTAPSAAAAGADQPTLCADNTTLSATAPTNGTGQWSLVSGTGTVTSNTNPNSTVTSIGLGTLTLQWVVSSGSCTPSRDTVVITRQPGLVTANAGADRPTCASSVMLFANNPGSGNTGTWSAGGSQIFSDANNPNAIVSALDPGVNVLTWTITGPCGNSSDDVEITQSSSSIVVTATASEDTLCTGTGLTVSALVSGTSATPLTYVWSSSDNSLNATYQAGLSTSRDVTPSGSGWIYYSVSVTDTNGCGNGAIDSVYSVTTQVLKIPNLITPNGDNKNDCLQILDVNGFNILPGSVYELYNRWGQSVYKNEEYENGDFCGGDLADGMYYFYLKTGCGNKEFKGWLHILSNTGASNK